ncbi:MAG: hypothetical protein R3F59_35085 [Myxococcota bacterium]
MPPPTEPAPLPARIAVASGLVASASVGAAYGALLAPFVAASARTVPDLLPVVGWLRGGGALVLFVGLSWLAAGVTVCAAAVLAMDGRTGFWIGAVAVALWLGTGCFPLAAVLAVVLALARPIPPPRPAG